MDARARRLQEAVLYAKESHLFCLHVKPATMFCGFVIFTMSFMNIMVLFTKFAEFPHPDRETYNFNLDPRLKTNKLVFLFIIAEGLKLIISTLLIYGLTRCKASYLIPFFLMQLFYFFRSVSLFLEGYSNFQNNDVFQNDFYDPSLRNKNEMHQSLAMFIFFLTLLYKLYFIGCVFKCYKYLKIRAALNHCLDVEIENSRLNSEIAANFQPNPPSYSDCLNEVRISKEYDCNEQKLPSYDEACKIVAQNQAKNEATSPLGSTNLPTITLTT